MLGVWAQFSANILMKHFKLDVFGAFSSLAASVFVMTVLLLKSLNRSEGVRCTEQGAGEGMKGGKGGEREAEEILACTLWRTTNERCALSLRIGLEYFSIAMRRSWGRNDCSSKRITCAHWKLKTPIDTVWRIRTLRSFQRHVTCRYYLHIWLSHALGPKAEGGIKCFTLHCCSLLLL